MMKAFDNTMIVRNIGEVRGWEEPVKRRRDNFPFVSEEDLTLEATRMISKFNRNRDKNEKGRILDSVNFTPVIGEFYFVKYGFYLHEEERVIFVEDDVNLSRILVTDSKEIAHSYVGTNGFCDMGIEEFENEAQYNDYIKDEVKYYIKHSYELFDSTKHGHYVSEDEIEIINAYRREKLKWLNKD